MKIESESTKAGDAYDQYKYFDWYNYEKVEKLREDRAKKYIAIVRKWSNAKEKEDKKMMEKAVKELAKHTKQDETLKKKAQSSGVCWY